MKKSESVAHFLKKAAHIVLVPHQKPDGDAIGSCRAIQLAFPDKKVEIAGINYDPIYEKILGKINLKPHINDEADLIILVDCCQLPRTNFANQLRLAYKNKKLLLAIDHHSNCRPSKLIKRYYIDRHASSTAQIILEILTELKIDLNEKLATSLLLGIYTDTSAFKLANTSSEILKISAQLVGSGAKLKLINLTFQPYRSIIKTKLWGKIFTTLKINRYGIAFAVINKKMMDEIGATEQDLSGLASTLTQIDGAKMVMIFMENNDGWQVRFRSRHPNLQLKRLAGIFGGSSTQKAGGFKATKNLFSGKIING